MQYSDLKPMEFKWDSIIAPKLDKVMSMTHTALRFYGLGSWSVKFDNAKKRAGLCSYLERSISLSKHFIELNSFEEIEKIIKHEIAHAISHVYFGHSGHGRVWKRVAIAIGDDGQRCYDSTKVAMPKGKYVLECPNCHKEVTYHKKTSVIKACAACCNKFNNGKFSMQYAFQPKGQLQLQA